MYSSKNRQFVLKQSNGRLWNLFYDERAGLCYSILTRRNTWSAPFSIQKDASPYFHAGLDRDDRIHILFQNRQGGILYSQIDGDRLNTVPVLNSKSPAVYNKHLFAAAADGGLDFLFVLRHGESWILSHQTIKGEKINTPRVIDYVENTSRPYCALYDRANNLYVFYAGLDNKSYRIGSKKLTADRKGWSGFLPVSGFDGHSGIPSAICDKNAVFHLCYQKSSLHGYELVYRQKIPDKDAWSDETVIHASSAPFNDSSILLSDKNLFIFWVRSDDIYFSLSKDNGKTWSRPSRYGFPSGRQLLCIAYDTNSPYEKDRMFVKDVPGVFIGGVKLAFLPDITSNDANLSPDELKNMIVDSLKLLDGSVEELKDSGSKMKDDLSQLVRRQANLERELTKLSVRLNLIEASVNEAKSLGNRLEKLGNKLESLQNDINAVKLEKERNIDRPGDDPSASL